MLVDDVLVFGEVSRQVSTHNSSSDRVQVAVRLSC